MLVSHSLNFLTLASHLHRKMQDPSKSQRGLPLKPPFEKHSEFWASQAGLRQTASLKSAIVLMTNDLQLLPNVSKI